MDKGAKQAFIQSIARRNQTDPTGSLILWSRHAIAELANEGRLRRTVEDALIDCAVIEDYPRMHRSLPDCLVLSWLANQEPVHAVIAIDETQGRLFVVTVYQPSAEEWKSDWQTRK
jgi:Domain of unknown function (DUF4258)